MKNKNKVKMCLCALFGFVLTGCHEFVSPTSQFGTGTYRCFYRNVQNGQFYKGEDSTQKGAAQNGKNLCIQRTQDWDHRYCQFADCVFK